MRRRAILAAVYLIGVASTLPASAHTYQEVPLGGVSPNALRDFVLAFDLIRETYTQEVTDETLFNHATAGMLARLDPYAEFLDKDAFANLQAFAQGDLAGVGIRTQYDETAGAFVVSEIVKGSVADQEGIALGDYLHKVSDVPLTAMHSALDVRALLMGIAGTQVKVEISKDNRYRQSLILQRNHRTRHSVQVTSQDGVAVVHIPVFQSTTRQEILDGLAALGTPIGALVLDVRGNPGGVFEAAGEVAALFLQDAVIARLIDNKGNAVDLATHLHPTLMNMPLVLLQNRYSASAAEVLAVGLQSHHRALVVGERSYGKGSVQSVHPISDEAAVKLTTAYYEGPAGEIIDKVGVDVDVALTGNPDTWHASATALAAQKALAHPVQFGFSNDF